ncbi:hypothetical protein BKA70DRAFT_1578872 [Coprinopsis sp. MPI-PUGE-AT-0042]|nr:hypothetical protein BKA70DRAFT_1578872 [Coprinopsis sp. MPI-PUGE-AT-0042]
MDSNPNRLSFREDRIAIIVTYLSTSIWGVQFCLSIHAFTRFYTTSLDKQQQRVRYLALLSIIMILSTFPLVLFVREPYVPLIDSRSYHDLFNAVGTANECAALIGCKGLLALVGNGFMAWRAVTIWSASPSVKRLASAAFTCYIGICVLSVAFQVHALRSLAAAAPVLDFDHSHRWSLGDSPINPMLQAIFRRWRVVEFATSVGFNAILAASIYARLISMAKSQEPRPRSATASFEFPVTCRRLSIALLDSALPFSLLGIAGLLSRGHIYASENFATSPMIDITDLTHTLWNQVLALGTQVMLFRILSGTAVA